MSQAVVGKTAIIIAVNPMPRLYVADLVRELVATHEVKVLTFYRSTLFDPAVVGQCTSLGAEVRQFAFDGRLDELRQMRSAGRLLRQWMRAKEVDVFHCQPNHLLTNYPTFVGRDRSNGRVHTHLLPDGLANFYTPLTAPYERQMKQKAVIGRALGIPFRPYRGTYLAAESGAYDDYWFVGNPGVMSKWMATRRFDVPPPPLLEEVRADTWLFIGQPSSGEDFEAAYAQVLESALQVSGGRIHYKLHPAESGDRVWTDRLTELGFVVRDDTVPAERLALSYGHVVSIASSVVMNLRMLGWLDSTYSVMDVDLLETLTLRSRAELVDVVEAAQGLGVRPLPITGRS